MERNLTEQFLNRFRPPKCLKTQVFVVGQNIFKMKNVVSTSRMYLECQYYEVIKAFCLSDSHPLCKNTFQIYTSQPHHTSGEL